MSDYLEYMRKYKPEICWRMLAADRVCVRLRGHNNEKHEPPTWKRETRRVLRNLRENLKDAVHYLRTGRIR